jgi:hypothetical protein
VEALNSLTLGEMISERFFLKSFKRLKDSAIPR